MKLILFLLSILNFTSLKAQKLILNDSFINQNSHSTVISNKTELTAYYQNQYFIKDWSNKGFRFSKKAIKVQFQRLGNSKFSTNNLQISYAKTFGNNTHFSIGSKLPFLQQEAYGISLQRISPSLGISYQTPKGYLLSTFINQNTQNSDNYYPDAIHCSITKRISNQLITQLYTTLSIDNPMICHLNIHLIPDEKFKIEASIRNGTSPFAFAFCYQLNKRLSLMVFSKYHLQLNHSLGSILSFQI